MGELGIEAKRCAPDRSLEQDRPARRRWPRADRQSGRAPADERRPVAVSAVTGEGIERLTAAIEARLAARRQTLEVALDPADGAGLSWLYRHSEVLEKRLRDDGRLAVTVRAEPDKAARVRAKFTGAIELSATYSGSPARSRSENRRVTRDFPWCAARQKAHPSKNLSPPPENAPIMRLSRLVTEGCLAGIFRHGAGSGGRGMTLSPEMRRKAARRSKPRSSRRACRASRRSHWRWQPARSEVLGTIWIHQRWIGGLPIRKERRGRLKGKSTGGGTEQTYKHRARDALGMADLRHYCFDKPRCREASRPAGPLGPEASRAPSAVFRGRRKDIRRGRTPRRPKNRGGGALAWRGSAIKIRHQKVASAADPPRPGRAKRARGTPARHSRGARVFLRLRLSFSSSFSSCFSSSLAASHSASISASVDCSGRLPRSASARSIEAKRRSNLALVARSTVFRIGIEMTREIDQREQQIADFARGRACVLSALSSSASISSRLLADLGEHGARIVPVEADAAGLLPAA